MLMDEKERWVTIDEVASHLGVTKDSIYRWVEKKRFPAHRVGRLFRFKLSEVDEWVRSGGAGETNDSPTRGKKTDRQTDKYN